MSFVHVVFAASADRGRASPAGAARNRVNNSIPRHHTCAGGIRSQRLGEPEEFSSGRVEAPDLEWNRNGQLLPAVGEVNQQGRSPGTFERGGGRFPHFTPRFAVKAIHGFALGSSVYNHQVLVDDGT